MMQFLQPSHLHNDPRVLTHSLCSATQNFLDVAVNKFGAVSSLGVASVTGEAQQWPYVTYANFHQRAATARKQSGSIFITVNPYVTHEQRDDWEAYSMSNASQWV